MNWAGAEQINEDLRILENAWFSSLIKYELRLNMSPGKELCRLMEIWQNNRWINLGVNKFTEWYPGSCSGQIH